MTNFNGIYKQHRRSDNKRIKYVIYNASADNSILFKGHTDLLTRTGIIETKRQEIEEGLSDNYSRKKEGWMVNIAVAKAKNQDVRIRFEEEERF